MTAPHPRCRSCDRDGLEPVLSLGRMALANALLTADQLGRPEPVYPLDLVLCPRCALVQITETVPPEELFSQYLYFSSYSDTMVRHAREIVERLIRERRLGGSSLAVELASNDGYLLQHFVAAGVPVLGVEPAANIAKVAQEKGVRTVCDFFGRRLASELRDRGERADVVLANNVLAHVADLNGFVEGIATLLKPDGMAVVEVPYVKEMIDRCEFDTIYHEHLCYFSVTALDRLFRRHGLVLADVERLPIHGGSLRLFAAPGGAPSRRVSDHLREESAWGVDRIESYRDFGRKVERIKTDLVGLLKSLKAEGKRLAGYGAAAKATVLLNYCGVGTDTLDFVADRSPHKVGKYVPGVRIPVAPPGRLLEAMPDYTVLFAWNVAAEVLEQQAEYRRRGGRFIIPVPEVTVV
jgi:SAM-dependent methyltransferase